MQKSREDSANMLQRTGMNAQGAGNQSAGQAHPQSDVSRQELVVPKWRGPFEGYR
ncbi:MAG: hypothetical protein Q7I97_01615 [Thermovirgaceae bacterium]|nr:hypothetical protein [Thermovirgaceae bacterium]